ncbi:MAG: valine--tRNA ligase, partial [Propionibacteriales bacterium]|nr:valine--tRNA ligase [Propionibacteriales bacterium]
MARPGMDSPFDESQMKVGRRLAMKVLNASKFALSMSSTTVADPELIINPMDRALLAGLAEVITEATRRFEAYDYTGALEVAETFFWQFCDDYVELIKERAYGAQGEAQAASAHHTLITALDVQLRLLAPIMPFVTDEVWSWWHDSSIHHAAWPTVDELSTTGDAALLVDLAAGLIGLRGAKSQAKVSMKTPITLATISGPAASLERLRLIEADLRAVGRITGEVVWQESDQPVSVTAELEPQPS